MTAAALPQHHPEADILLAYAGGTLAEGLALVVATHLALCPDCRRLAGDFDALGGTLFDRLGPSALAPDAFARTMARIGDRPPEEPPARAPAQPDADAWWQWEPLAPYLHGRQPRVWRPLGRGIGYSPIRRRGQSGASAILLRVAADAALPRHGHAGTEMTVVLEGGYRDQFGRYAVGDFSSLDNATMHKPVTDGDAICVSLIALTGPLLFGAAAARWLQMLVGI